MIRSCPTCGQENRIPARHLGNRGRCGQCHAALEALDTPLNVDVQEFREVIADSPLPVLVDFWAAWCGPCRMAAPEVAKTAKTMAGRALVLKVDTAQHPELASQFQVSGIPHFVVLRGGRPVHAQSGLVSHREMARWLAEAAAH